MIKYREILPLNSQQVSKRESQQVVSVHVTPSPKCWSKKVKALTTKFFTSDEYYKKDQKEKKEQKAAIAGY